MTIIILGHRGMGATSKSYINQFLPIGVMPENSLMAFQAALESGAQGVEMDVYLTKDNVVAVSRDDILDRNVDGYHSCWAAGETPILGKISDKTFAELQDAKYSLGSNQFIPSLTSVIDLIIEHNKNTLPIKAKINIELQGDNLLVAKYSWDIIRSYVENTANDLTYDDFVVNSFNFKMLTSFRAAQKVHGLDYMVELLLCVSTNNMFGNEALLPGWVPVEIEDGKPKLDASGLPSPKSKVNAQYLTGLIASCKQYAINYLDITSSDLRHNLLEICSQSQMGLSMACNPIRARAEHDLWCKQAANGNISDSELEMLQLQNLYMLSRQYPKFTFYCKCDHIKEALALFKALDQIIEDNEQHMRQAAHEVLVFSCQAVDAADIDSGQTLLCALPANNFILKYLALLRKPTRC